MVVGNSNVVFPKIVTILGLLSAFLTISSVTVESFPPEKEITNFSSSYFDDTSRMKPVASSIR